MTLQESITYFSTFSPIIPILVGLRKRIFLLWIYAIAGFVSNFLMVVVLHGMPERMLVANIFLPLEFLIISEYYRREMNGGYRVIMLSSWLVFVVGAAACLYSSDISFAITNAITKFNWIGSTIFCFYYIIFGICGFHFIVKRPLVPHLEKSPFFIVNAVFILYASSVFLVLLFSQYLIDKDKISIFWKYLEVINILKYVLLARAFTLKNT